MRMKLTFKMIRAGIRFAGRDARFLAIATGKADPSYGSINPWIFSNLRIQSSLGFWIAFGNLALAFRATSTSA